MNKLSDEKRAMILKALVEGNSIRATARLTGTSKKHCLSVAQTRWRVLPRTARRSGQGRGR